MFNLFSFAKEAALKLFIKKNLLYWLIKILIKVAIIDYAICRKIFILFARRLDCDKD